MSTYDAFLLLALVLNFLVIIAAAGELIIRLIHAYVFDDWSQDFKVFDQCKKVGGIRFIRLGRVAVTVSIRKKEA